MTAPEVGLALQMVLFKQGALQIVLDAPTVTGYHPLASERNSL